MSNNDFEDLDFTGVVYALIGDCYRHQGKLDEALDNTLLSIKCHRSVEKEDKSKSLALNLGDIYFSQKKYDMAYDNYHKGLKTFENIGNNYGISHANHKLGNFFTELAMADSALYYYVASAKLAKSTGQILFEIAVNEKISQIYLKDHEMEKAIDVLEESIRLRGQIAQFENIDLTLNNLGYAYISLDSLQKARKYLFHHYLSNDTLTNIFSNINFNRANSYYLDNNLDSALIYYHKAHTVSTLNDSIGNNLYESLMLIGKIHFERKELIDAERFLLKGVDELKKDTSYAEPYLAYVFEILSSLAGEYFHSSRWEDAIRIHQQIKLFLTFYGFPTYMECNNIGVAYIKNEKPDSALYFFEESLQECFSINDSTSNNFKGILYNNIGTAHKNLKDWKSATIWLNKSIDYNNQIGSSDEVLCYSYSRLCEVYFQTNDYVLAWNAGIAAINKLGHYPSLNNMECQVINIMLKIKKNNPTKFKGINLLKRYSQIKCP